LTGKDRSIPGVTLLTKTGIVTIPSHVCHGSLRLLARAFDVMRNRRKWRWAKDTPQARRCECAFWSRRTVLFSALQNGVRQLPDAALIEDILFFPIPET